MARGFAAVPRIEAILRRVTTAFQHGIRVPVGADQVHVADRGAVTLLTGREVVHTYPGYALAAAGGGL
jgi:hypothetical protein